MADGPRVQVEDLLARGIGGALEAERQGLIKTGGNDAEVVPAGDYDVTIDYAGGQKSDGKRLVVFAKINSGPEAGKRVSLNPGNLKSEPAAGILLQNLRALLGDAVFTQMQSAAAAKGEAFTLDDLKLYLNQRRVQVTLVQNEYPKDSGRISMQMAIGKAKPLAADGSEAKAAIAPEDIPQPDPAVLAKQEPAPGVPSGTDILTGQPTGLAPVTVDNAAF